MCAQDVQQQIEEAKKSKEPPIEDLWNNIYLDPLVAILPVLTHSHCAQLSQDRTMPPLASRIHHARLCQEWTRIFQLSPVLDSRSLQTSRTGAVASRIGMR